MSDEERPVVKVNVKQIADEVYERLRRDEEFIRRVRPTQKDKEKDDEEDQDEDDIEIEEG